MRHEGATTGGPTPFNHHHFRSGLQLIPHPGSHGDPSPTPSAEVSLVKGLVSLHPPVVSFHSPRVADVKYRSGEGSVSLASLTLSSWKETDRERDVSQ